MIPKTVVILCMRTGAPGPRIAGHGKSTCAECGLSIDVAPSTIELMESDPRQRFRLLCVDCGLPLIQSPDAKFGNVTAAQRKEIAAYVTNEQNRKVPQ